MTLEHHYTLHHANTLQVTAYNRVYQAPLTLHPNRLTATSDKLGTLCKITPFGRVFCIMWCVYSRCSAPSLPSVVTSHNSVYAKSFLSKPVGLGVRTSHTRTTLDEINFAL